MDWFSLHSGVQNSGRGFNIQNYYRTKVFQMCIYWIILLLLSFVSHFMHVIPKFITFWTMLCFSNSIGINAQHRISRISTFLNIYIMLYPHTAPTMKHPCAYHYYCPCCTCRSWLSLTSGHTDAETRALVLMGAWHIRHNEGRSRSTNVLI